MTRNNALDALRGYAIITMILSGSIAYKILPGFMYHAQVPPPNHQFNGNLPGITWVDLVFPFFLFSMGAAIPLFLKKYIEKNTPSYVIIGIALKRFLLLAFFALLFNHLKAWVIAEQPTSKEQLISLFGFVLLCFQFLENKEKLLWLTITKVVSFTVGIILLRYLPFWKGTGFNFYKSDIIIMVLANMAFFGTTIYYFTRTNQLLRISILPFIMAIFFAATLPDWGWAKHIYNFKNIGKLNIDWLYQFYFLKYLFIIIPATIIGEYLIQLSQVNTIGKQKNNLLAFIGIALVVFNLVGLYSRFLFPTFLITILYCWAAFYLVKNENQVFKKIIQTAIYLLLLGWCFEAFEGGIKKDKSTYSYYFITTGLAIFSLVSFMLLQHNKLLKRPLHIMATVGKNPMVAYCTGSLLILPMLELTNVKKYWDQLHHNNFEGIIKGVLFTIVAILPTIYFTRKKWFWKT